MLFWCRWWETSASHTTCSATESSCFQYPPRNKNLKNLHLWQLFLTIFALLGFNSLPIIKKQPTLKRLIAFLVPVVGVEPTRYCYQRILSPSRLPIPSHRLLFNFQLYYFTTPAGKKQVFFYILYTLFALSRVIFATSSKVIPLISAIFSATYRTLLLSFRVPLLGSGAR